MNVSELKAYFSEDFIEETRLLSLLPEQEQQVQDYLQGIAQRPDWRRMGLRSFSGLFCRFGQCRSQCRLLPQSPL